MRTTTIDTPTGYVSIHYPDVVAFMYSRQPVIVELSDTDVFSGPATVTVTNNETNRSYTEQRAFYNGRAEFDISRIMQLLAPDVDTITSRVDYETGQTLAQTFILTVETTENMEEGFEVAITGMYGALDPGETYGKDAALRLWVNFPQTINIWKNLFNNVRFTFGDTGTDVTPPTYGSGPCWECEFKAMAAQAPDEYAALLSRPTDLLFVTRKYIAEEGSVKPQTGPRGIRLTIDHSEPKDGEYLRWLNRRGEMSYWLFTRSTLRVATSRDEAFRRHYGGNIAAPDGGIYKNSDKASFNEAREMALGATAVTLEEFEYISDLGTSPVVERMLTQDNGIRWQRVNVTAGTFERQIKRGTPSMQDIEVIIELPNRNTIKL